MTDHVALGSFGVPAFEVGIDDVHQSDNRWIRPGFSNYRSPVAMSDKNARSILLSNDALRSGDIFFKGRLRLLDNADVVAILGLSHEFLVFLANQASELRRACLEL